MRQYWKSKLGHIKQTYKGYSYDSRLEAQYDAKLDLLIGEGEIIKRDRQVKLELDVKGKHIANYYADFKVFYPDGRIEIHEVKGAESQLWRMKWNLAKALFQDWNFRLIKSVY